ncbi:nuclear mRNA export, poly(A)+RNA binding protein [Gryganskiella cystojenkinii]|nr:nuclear mRNA export, poly(A)+RNA binding protein [Gryganskiella cystojenkinii]
MNRGARGSGRGGGRVSGNQETGLFTAAGRDRAAANGMSDVNAGGANNGAGGGGGGGGRRSGGGPMRDNGRKRGGGRRTGGLRGSSAHLPLPGRNDDRDGDMDMGGGDKKSNFSPYQRPGRNRPGTVSEHNNSNLNDTLIVFILGTGVGSDSGLFDFLSRKASPVKITPANKKPNTDGNSISFHVPTLQQASALKALSGIRYKQQKIIIKTTGDQRIVEDRSRSKGTNAVQSTGTIDAIRTFIRSRHSNGFLDLENMAADPTLRAAAVLPPGAGATRGRFDVGAVFMKVASEEFPNITTISFASNGLRSLRPLSAVTRFFPNIHNLSFKGNMIEQFVDLDAFSGTKKLPQLRELILLDNPIRDNDIAKNKDDIEYRSKVIQKFPSIQLLDGTPVGPKISFGSGDAAKEASKGPPPLPLLVRGNFFDSPGTESLVLEFLTSYFKLFDTDRNALEHMYDNSATFSYSAVKKGNDTWGGYNDSRNLSRIKDLKQRTNMLQVGNVAIVKEGLLQLPKTTHNLSDASKVRVDAWQTGGLLPAVCIYIMVHGEFQQANGKNKSFDRSFIIAPAPPNSQAAMRGWKCLIITDQLTVRSYNGSSAWQPEPEPGTTGLNAPTPVATPIPGMTVPSPAPGAPVAIAEGAGPNPSQAPMAGITPEQHAMAQELQRLTGLNYPYAVQCLTAIAWDIQAAVALVDQERANIPQYAWESPRF